MKTVRVKLNFTRKHTTIETGYVCVDVPEDATVADAYRKAYEKDYVEYLPRTSETVKEDWEFVLEKPVNA
jgi:hypothetical protein